MSGHFYLLSLSNFGVLRHFLFACSTLQLYMEFTAHSKVISNSLTSQNVGTRGDLKHFCTRYFSLGAFSASDFLY